jgi:hypothetical protein
MRLMDETAAKVPDRCGEHPAGAGDAAHLLRRPPGIGHEVEGQLRDRRGEQARIERQVQRVRLLEGDAFGARPPAREGQVRRRDVDRAHAPAGTAAPQLERDAPGAAADVEDRPVDRQIGEVDQSFGQPAGPAAEEALVGSAVVRQVGTGGAHETLSRPRP